MKTNKQDRLQACSQQLNHLLKDLQSEWQKNVPALLLELTIHASFLRRIKHQFRRSKVIQRSQSLQACSRRLHSLRDLKFRKCLVYPDLTFAQCASVLLVRISDAGKLISQLARYAELISEANTQSLAQEHYFFFGTDLSMLATTSRIWVLSKAFYTSLESFWTRIRECLIASGVEKKVFHQLPKIFPGLVEDPLSPVSVPKPVLVEVPRKKSKSKSVDKPKKRRKLSGDAVTLKSEQTINQAPLTGALGRFS